ncbi:MAG: hypothetical protein KDD77_17180, partial [Caldilineaceae bacterium]|nr:hypothetical protein [Caldilineaceae bacterium]
KQQPKGCCRKNQPPSVTCTIHWISSIHTIADSVFMQHGAAPCLPLTTIEGRRGAKNTPIAPNLAVAWAVRRNTTEDAGASVRLESSVA